MKKQMRASTRPVAHLMRPVAFVLTLALCLGAWATDYYWIGGESGAWNSASNWSLEEGGEAATTYPNSFVQNKTNYTSASDPVHFSNDATVSISDTKYMTTINLKAGAKLTLTGGGELKTAYANNSGSLVVTGDGELHLKGVRLVFPYNTRGNDSGRIDVPIVVEESEAENNLYLATGSSGRNSKLTLSAAISGTGDLTFGAGTFSQTTLTVTSDVSSYSGTITVNAKVSSLSVGGSATYILGSDNVVNSLSSVSFAGGVLKLDESSTADVSKKISAGTHTAAVKVDVETTHEWANSVGGSYGLIKTGTGRLALASTGAIPACAVEVAEGELEIPVGSTFTAAVTVSGTGKIVVAGSADWEGEKELFTVPAGTTFAEGQVVIEGLGGHTAYTTSVDSSTGAVTANITPATLTWNGANNDEWTGADKWLIGEDATTFLANDAVAFTDDSFKDGTTELTVAVPSDVTPSAVTISPGTDHTYTFSGEGKVTTEGFVVVKSGGGTLELGADVFSGLSIASAGGDVTFDPGTGKEINLAALTSSEDKQASIKSGTLTLSAIPTFQPNVAAEAALFLDLKGGSGSFSRYVRGSGDIYFTNGTFSAQADNASSIKQFSTFSGTLHLMEGATYRSIIRNQTVNGSYAVGTGILSLEGGTFHVPDSNSQNAMPIGCSKVVVTDGMISTISNQGRSMNLTVSAPLYGGGILNIANTKSPNGDKKFHGVRFSGNNANFFGTLNFNNTEAPADESGLVASGASSPNTTINVVGAPSALTHLVDFSVTADETLNIGSLNVASANAAVRCRNPLAIALGGNGGSSTLNGAFSLQNAGTYEITKTGTGTLTLGEGFQMKDAATLGLTEDDYSANTYTRKITINAGKFVCNASDLSGVTIRLENAASNFALTEEQLAAKEPVTFFTTNGTVELSDTTANRVITSTPTAKWVLVTETNEETGVTTVKGEYISKGLLIIVR